MSRGGRFKSENAFGNWSHPRDLKGRFTPKLSHSLRASTRSVSYNAGARIPIVPGRINLYTGALIRVERTDRTAGLLSGAADKVIDGFVSKTGNKPSVAKAAALLKTGEVEVGGIRVQRSAIINSPTIRVSGAKQLAKGTTTHNQVASTVSRSPNRKPRTRSASKRKAISAGSQRPSTISR